MVRFAAAIVGILWVVPLCAQPTAECDRGAVLTPAGLGPLRVGMPMDSVGRVCRIIPLEPLTADGMLRHQVRVGTDTVSVWESNGKVDFIRLDSPLHRTADSLGVGSSGEQILHLANVAGEAGDGFYVLFTREGPLCGLLFYLDHKTAQMMEHARGDPLRTLAMRGAGVVVQIDVRGECRPGRGP